MKSFNQFVFESYQARENIQEIAPLALAALPVAAKLAGYGLAAWSAYEAGKKLKQGNYGGAAVDALGMIPVGGKAFQLAQKAGAGKHLSRLASTLASTGKWTGLSLADPGEASAKPAQPTQPAKPTTPVAKKVIADKSGRGGTVSTNTAYQTKLGGFKATSTRGDQGQQMIRAKLGNQGINRVASGQATAGKSYAATLGGMKGTIKYDDKGNKTFQALKMPKP